MFKRIIQISLVLAIASMFLGWNWGSKFEEVSSQNGIVSIPISKVNDGKAHYYSYKAGGKEIHFFLLKSKDGVIRAAFDACDVCFPEKKGYRQEGDYMICNNCGQRFHSTKINVVKGGCNPSPLRRFNDSKYVKMTVEDITKGAFYF